MARRASHVASGSQGSTAAEPAGPRQQHSSTRYYEGRTVIGSSKAERKVSAALRAKLSLQQAWERIDFAFDVVKPTVLDVRKLEAENEIELTEQDLVSLLATGTLTIEAGDGDAADA